MGTARQPKGPRYFPSVPQYFAFYLNSLIRDASER